MPERPRLVLATQEVWPLVLGGGIARHLAEVAGLLGAMADVTVLAPEGLREEYERLRAAGDERLPGDLRFVWFDEPGGDLSPMLSSHHAASLAVWRALRELAAEAPIDLVEFPDYRGIGAVAIDAKRSGCPELAATTLVVRLHTSWEMTAAADGQPREDLASRSVMALERLSLRFADRLLAPGEGTLGIYRRFYGAHRLAPATLVPVALVLGPENQRAREPREDGELRILYVGRMQRLKGVIGLVQGLRALPDPDVRLTMVGGDTATSPTGGSMRSHLEHLAGDDPRIVLRGSASRDEVAALMRSHDIVVVPSRFESYGYVVREALAANRPVLATPVGGMTDGFQVGRSGWLTTDGSDAAIAQGLADLVTRREEIAALIREGAPRATVEAMADDDLLRERYAALVKPASGAPAASSAEPPPVTAIVTVRRGDGSLAATLDALEAQRWPDLEIMVVADDPERVPVAQLARIGRLAYLPDGARVDARCLGLAQRRRDGHVLFLAAGETLAPGFLARCCLALAAPARPAYATAYGDGRDPVNAPLGNAVAALIGEFDAAASVALLPADALDGGLPDAPDGCEERVLYDRLAASGRYGTVVPDVLVRGRRTRCPDPRAAGRALAAVAIDEELWTAG
jgi:glycosyltransferase involved in cell wall biosynthesis